MIRTPSQDPSIDPDKTADPKDKAETFGPAQGVSKSKSANDTMPGDSPVRQGKKRKVVMDSNPRVSRSQVREDTIMDEGR
ncbi:hypothetical protein K457DRAFT_16143 [Linnemannia elongata AG-77]|uniref:Uncharacterized protein n=1 Tax=Linnemannia elongata AG-77 TaxID=1314771 RepID=A0A197K525_9FUNG|nr:hypothetical protein K457DRAFT_16143 [Linnemannia elongata AG-77]